MSFGFILCDHKHKVTDKKVAFQLWAFATCNLGTVINNICKWTNEDNSGYEVCIDKYNRFIWQTWNFWFCLFVKLTVWCWKLDRFCKKVGFNFHWAKLKAETIIGTSLTSFWDRMPNGKISFRVFQRFIQTYMYIRYLDMLYLVMVVWFYPLWSQT